MLRSRTSGGRRFPGPDDCSGGFGGELYPTVGCGDFCEAELVSYELRAKAAGAGARGYMDLP